MRGAAVLIGLVLVAGACSSEEPAASTGSPAAGLRWTTAAEMPTARTELVAAALDGRVYAAGGFLGDGSHTDRVEVYDPARDAWSAGPSLPEPLHHTSLVEAKGRLYLVGGFRTDGSATAAVWSLGPDDERWRQEADMPVARGAHAAAALDGRVHVLGGASEFGPRGRFVSGHLAYDPSSRSWVERAPLPNLRDHLAAAVVDGKLVAAGGRYIVMTRITARADVYDAAADTWHLAGDMPTARAGAAAAGASGRVFVFGGESATETFTAAESFSPADGSWQEAPPMPTARHGLGAATLPDGRIVVVGGGPAPGLSVSGATEILAAA